MSVKMIKLSEWAEQNGINYQTAYRWFKAGKLPVNKAIQTETKTILVEAITEDPDEVINAKMTDESLPLTSRLMAAYKYIQKQSAVKDPVQEHKETIEKSGLKVKKYVPDKEKQDILNSLCGQQGKRTPYTNNSNLPQEIQTLIEKRERLIKDGGDIEEIGKLYQQIEEMKSEFYKEERPNILHKEQMCIREDVDIMKKDVDELLSNVFGEGTVLMDRLESRIAHGVKKALVDVFKNVETFDEFKACYTLTVDLKTVMDNVNQLEKDFIQCDTKNGPGRIYPKQTFVEEKGISTETKDVVSKIIQILEKEYETLTAEFVKVVSPVNTDPARADMIFKKMRECKELIENVSGYGTGSGEFLSFVDLYKEMETRLKADENERNVADILDILHSKMTEEEQMSLIQIEKPKKD